MMPNIKLVPHRIDYAQRIFELTSDPAVTEFLGFHDETVQETKKFIQYMIDLEEIGKAVSRVILNEENEAIGVTSLMDIDQDQKRCHLGSWLGHDYWGRGYNQQAKLAILRIAFVQLGMEHVFAGARKLNARSQKAQQKLPYIRLNVESMFPDVHAALELKEKLPCILNVIHKQDFLTYLKTHSGSEA